jgi:hypothetical protein
VTFPIPTKLLERICCDSSSPVAIAMCPDFELGSWRCKRLADHIFDWLPDVALRPREREALLYEPYKQLAQSCRRFFDVTNAEKRGEIGEVLIHAICRQEFGTIPFMVRLFYKMRTNDSVTSIDVAHLCFNEHSGDVELWLGEAKLYDDLDQARYRALQSIRALWDPDFLQEMKALVGPKVEPSVAHAEALTWLFADETSLDQLINRIVIPICIACDHPTTLNATERTDEYIAAISDELAKLRKYFLECVPVDVRFVCIFVPLNNKENLEQAVNDKVQSFL